MSIWKKLFGGSPQSATPPASKTSTQHGKEERIDAHLVFPLKRVSRNDDEEHDRTFEALKQFLARDPDTRGYSEIPKITFLTKEPDEIVVTVHMSCCNAREMSQFNAELQQLLNRR